MSAVGREPEAAACDGGADLAGVVGTEAAWRRFGRYAGLAGAIVLVVVGLGWPWTGTEGRRGLLLAGGIALVLQLGSFGILVVQRTGSPGFLAAWVGSTLVRFAVVVGAAFLVAGMEGVDTLIALLTLVGLLFVLLLLEPLMLRSRERDRSNGE